ncbi:MAG: tetratricopeptide repeat protein [Thermoplasmata archaeon]|nr:MAG: tetratricopeptide repeat protein [Thermoplasmata archaeon]
MADEQGFKSRFVGREKILGDLQNLMDESIQGKGQLALISGEAGIGKTRLVCELKSYAAIKNVRCLEGSCIYHEVSDPYLPFIEALSDITTPTIVDDSQKYVTIDEAFLINNAGNVVSYASRIGASILDEDIVGGMLAAVESFVKDAFGDKESTQKGLDTLVYGPTRILIEHGDLVFLAVVLSGGDPEGLREDLKELVRKIEDKYYDTIKNWDGVIAKVRDITDIIKDLTTVKYKIKRAIKDIDIKKEKDRVFERVLQLIIEASEKDPILLILEDIHWADISSLQLLQYIARNTIESRVFICVTYRPEELDDIGDKKVHPLREMILRMSRHKMFTSIELESLKPSEVSEMMISIFKMPELQSEFVDRIYRETEGNPFYIEEVLHSFQDEGIINYQDGAWKVKEVSETAIPSTIKDLITLRMDRLDDSSINVIKYASVIGQGFNFNVLSQNIEINEESLITTLERLEDKKLIQVDIEDDELYRFNHAKIREVVYDTLSRHRKRLLHQRVAKSIEDLNKNNLEDVLYQLAHHYSNTRDYKKALDYSTSAGEKSSSEFAMDEAYEYYKLALEALQQMDKSDENKRKHLDVITHLGDICYVIGEWEQAFEYYNTMEKLSEELKDEKKMVEGYRNIGLLHINRNEWDAAQMNLEKGLELGIKIQDDHGLADIRYHLGTFYEKRGDLEKAIKAYGESMGNAVNIGDSILIANAYLGIGRVYAQHGQYDESLTHMQKSIEILEGSGDLNTLVKAYFNIGATYFYSDDFSSAIKYEEKALMLAKKIGNIRLEGYGLANLGESYIKRNELDKAIKSLNDGLKIFKKLDEKLMISDIYKHYGCLYKLKEEWDSSTDYFNKSLEISRELNMLYYVGCGLLEFGLMHKAKGDLEKAREQLSEALKIFRDLNNQEMLKKIEKELEALDKKD